MYTVDYFIKKFEAIPEEKLCSSSFTIGYSGDVHCALGHCGVTDSTLNITTEATELQKVFDTHSGGTIDVLNVNDGHFIFYDQPTPKQRILAALYDIKQQQAMDYADDVINNIEPAKLNQPA